MTSPLLHLHLDESGGFEGAPNDEVMVMAVLSRWGDRPNTGELPAMWREAWCPLDAPRLAGFHAATYLDKQTLERVAANLAAIWAGRAALSVVSCAHRAMDGRPPDCIEMFVEAATCAALEAVSVRPGPLPGLSLRIELAYRSGFNTWAAEREISRRLVERLRGTHGGVPVNVNIWVTDVDRSPFLTFSDIFCNVTYRAMRSGGAATIGTPAPLEPTGPWRLSARQIAFLRGTPFEGAEKPRLPTPPAPPPPPAPPLPSPGSRPSLTDLYLELVGPKAPDAETWIAAHAPDPSLLQPDERAGTVEDILLMGDLLVESRRAWVPARRALALARDLSWHPAWREGWEPLADDRVDLRLDSLALVIANHEGAFHTTELDLLKSRARAERLMAAESDTERVLIHHNREVIGLTNTFRFDDAAAHITPVLQWLRARSASSPFGARSVQLGQFLGTAGQLYALRAHATNAPALLDEAWRCFEAARDQDDDPGHVQRQETYLLHLLAERVRLGGSAADALTAANQLASPQAAIARLAQAPITPSSIGDAFTVHAWAKLAVLTGRAMPEAAALVEHLSRALPEAHPWPLLAVWLTPLAVGARPSARMDLAAALAKRASQPDLVGFILAILLLDRRPAPDSAVRRTGSVPESIEEGWERGGYAARLAHCRAGKLPATHVLPFNFC